MGVLPVPVEELLDTALVGELTVVDDRGRPVTHPLIPLYDGERIYLTSSVLFSRKLEHIKANPKVSLSITDPVRRDRRAVPPGHDPGRRDRGRLRTSTPGGSGTSSDLWRKKEPAIDFFLGKRVALPLFFERGIIEIRPRRAYLWEDGRTDAPPAGVRAGGGGPMSVATKLIESPRPSATATRSWPSSDDDGYPMSVATGFAVDAAQAITLDHVAEGPGAPPLGREVNVVFSHIRPQPGQGYDERRYVSLWGTLAARADGRLLLEPTSVQHWDEQEMTFFEFSERGVPQAHRYMDAAVRGDRPAGPPEARRPAGCSCAPRACRSCRRPSSRWPSAWRSPPSTVICSWWLALLTLVAAACVHLGLNVANDVFDTMSGADGANVNPTQFSGGSRVIHYGLLSMRQMVWLMVGFYAVGRRHRDALAVDAGLLAAVGSASPAP